MNLLFTEEAWDDYQYWLKIDKSILKKLNAFIKEGLKRPFEGIGKPEPLKFDMVGCWSIR